MVLEAPSNLSPHLWPPRLSCLSIGEIIEESVWASGAIWWSERFLNTHPATFDWHSAGSWTLLVKFQRTNRMYGQTYDLKQYMFGNAFHPYFGHEFLWETRSTSRIRHGGYHRYYVYPRSEQPMHMRQLCAGGSTDLGYQTCTSAYLFDTLVTGMATAACCIQACSLSRQLLYIHDIKL